MASSTTQVELHEQKLNSAGRFKCNGETSHFHQLMKWLAQNHAQKHLLSYPDKAGEYKINLTGADLERLTAFAGSKYADAFRQLPNGQVTGKIGFGDISTKIVAMVSMSTLSSYLSYIALHRLGFSPMIISPRLAEDGYAHLLRVVGCQAVLVASGHSELFQRIKRTFDGPLDVVPMLSDEELLAGLELPLVDLPDPCCRPGFIIHTGGTTGLPKPVPFDIGKFMGATPSGLHPEVDMPPALSTLPLYHMFGLGTFTHSLCVGVKMSLLNADRPVTATIVSQALDATGSRYLYTVPYVLKFFAEMDGGVEKLAALDYVKPGGSATPDELGNMLARRGVKMMTVYGQTESGATMAPIGTGVGEWNWYTPMPHAADFMEFEKFADDMYHLVIKKGLRSLKLSDRPDGSYGTKDIFRPHPDNLPGSDTRSGKAKWKFIGRQGDIIVLVNGENADPTPIENAVLQSPYVQLALAFGAGHERLGLLIIASEKAATMSKEELVKAITPQLEKGNALAADYAKISPDDIIVKPAGTPYPLTAKMTVQRPILHRTFAEEIEAHYAARDTVNKGQELTNQELRDVVRQVVEQEHQKHTDDGAEFDDDTDFFSMGMDSLQSSLVRRRLLRKIPLPEGARLATNVVFEYPTVNLLTSHIQDLRQKKLEGVASSSTRNPAAIAKAMVKKYVDLLTVGTDRATSNGGTREQKDKNHVVVLTGATGYLGAQVLKLLLDRADVSRVYCLIRTRKTRDHKTASQRILTALDNSLLLEELSPASKDKLVCFSTNLANADLGLSPTEYSEIQSSVTAVIHNAWSVNFNMSLESFEPNVASVAHLLKLSQATAKRAKPAAYIFISSIAAAIGVVSSGEMKAEERMYAWEEANPRNGYGQSKWVSEQICAEAANAKNSTFGSIRILRVAQISGDTKHGIWNPAEAIPAMVQSALTVGALPKMEGESNTLCWLPSDTTAAVVVDLTMADTERLAVFHVASPHTLRWNEDVLPAIEKAGVEVRIVPQHEWVQILEKSDNDIETNPPYKLIEHFRAAYGRKRGADDGNTDEKPTSNGGDIDTGIAKLALTKSLKASPSLQASPPVDSALVERYVRFWLKYWAGEHRSSPQA